MHLRNSTNTSLHSQLGNQFRAARESKRKDKPIYDLNSFLLALLLAPAGVGGTFAVLGPRTGSWPAVLSSVGHIAGPAAEADIFVALPGTPPAADWRSKVQNGAAMILEGSSPLAASFGFRPRAGGRFGDPSGRRSQSRRCP